MSRYDELLQGPNMPTTTITDGTQQQHTDQTRTSTGTSTTNSSTTGSQNQQQHFNLDMMSQVGRGALEQLIAQMAAGGTDAQRKMLQDEEELLQQLRAQQGEFSRETALGDAEGLMMQHLRQAMEGAMPQILSAQSGAGSSGDALSALLSQDVATRASEGAAAAGINAVGQYGGILSQILGTQANLVGNRDDRSVQGLLAALGIDAGSAKRGTVNTNTQSRENTTSTTNTSNTDRTTGTTNTINNQISRTKPTNPNDARVKNAI